MPLVFNPFTGKFDYSGGEKGDIGPPGTQGIQGPPGQGEKGDPGTPGVDGYTPVKGVDYFDGNDGADGSNGLDGADSIVPGPPGSPGYTPIKGVDYFDGEQGIQGNQGIQGVPGNDGSNGVDGYTPIFGVDYFNGSQGIQGVPGNDGSPGAPGNDGYTPIKGVDYFDGEQGIQGIQGMPGDPANISAHEIAYAHTNIHAPGSDNQDLSNLVVKETGKSLVADTEIAKIHASGSDNQDISGKVDKVTGSSLVPDSEIAKIHTSGSDNQDLSGLEPKQTGKSLSTNDLTAALKTSYDGAVTHAGSAHAPSGAEVNVNADWNASSGDAQIMNKPSIPAAQVQTDWNAVAGMGVLLNKPTISGSNTGDASGHSALALIDSQTFTGTPSAPTPVARTNTTRLATTAFVLGEGNSLCLTNNATTSSVSAVNTNLTFPIAANNVFVVDVYGTCSKATSATGLKFAINCPTSCVIKGFQLGGGATLAAALVPSLITAINTLGTVLATGTNIEVAFALHFCVVNGANPGSITLQFATVTSNVATVYAGTKMIYNRANQV